MNEESLAARRGTVKLDYEQVVRQEAVRATRSARWLTCPVRPFSTVLDLDTTLSTGGITNIPFVVKQANAVSMKSTFWIQELAGTDPAAAPALRLQYLQIVMLDFFPRRDGLPGLIGWPHVSINTLDKVSDAPQPVGFRPA